MFSLMIFMFCFFLGFIAMLFYLINKMDSSFRSLNDEHAQLRVLLRAMESRLDNMEKYLAAASGLRQYPEADREVEGSSLDEGAPQADPGHDPLLHLSFEAPQEMTCTKAEDNLELLLEPNKRKD